MRRILWGVILVLVLLGGVAGGCACEDGCMTTVTCIHSVSGDTYTDTVEGCRASCACWYEVLDQSTWCPGD